MTLQRKNKICALLKGIETGDSTAVSVVNPDKYIQHNPQTHEGGEGLAELFKKLAKKLPKVNIVRVFSDNDYVFAHTEYDFGSPRVGFEIFRFEGEQTVEHWDNIQPRKTLKISDHTMVDGPIEATDLDKTKYNLKMVQSFVEEVLLKKDTDKINTYINEKEFIDHSARFNNNLSALILSLSNKTYSDGITIKYDNSHRILSEGNFVLSVTEGFLDGVHSSFYDLYRIKHGKIVEHWDTTETIPPRSEWKNDNGKF